MKTTSSLWHRVSNLIFSRSQDPKIGNEFMPRRSLRATRLKKEEILNRILVSRLRMQHL